MLFNQSDLRWSPSCFGPMQLGQLKFLLLIAVIATIVMILHLQ